MQTPTAEQVRTLAPDGAAARAGEQLADPRRWSTTGRSDAVAWGLCQGSGSAPYQASVDLAGPAYTCSCPSRKIPCKHSLALLFLLADGSITPGSPPDWVASWLEGRAARAAAAATRAGHPAPVDDASRAKRIASREKKVAAGIDELDQWLTDLLRRGLDSARTEGYRFWDAMGARLVDAQAAGLGRSVRGLGSAANSGDGWPHLLLEGTGRLHMLCEAYRRADQLPEPLRADVRSLVGWTTKEEELESSDIVEDRWIVVGRRVDDTGQVITARTFLLGESSGRFALHLAFGVDAAPPTVLAVPPQVVRATLTFYPSATPLRAAVRPMVALDGEASAQPPAVSISQVLHEHAERLARNPFIDRWPVAIRDVIPILRDDGLVARDQEGRVLPVVPRSVVPHMLAVSGGHPVTVVGEWDGAVLRPLSVFAASRLVGLEIESDDARRPSAGGRAWDELVSAALLGTERSGERVVIPETAADLGSDGLERQILGAAATLTVRRRAGRRVRLDPGPVPEGAGEDPRPALTGQAARLFGLVVGERRSLLPEVLGLVGATRRRLPDEWLPDVMALGVTDPHLQDLIAGLGGPRASWLAGMLPELEPAADIAVTGDTSEDWSDAWDRARTPRQRLALARAARTADRPAARDALRASLEQVAGDERAGLIETFEVGLGPGDEPVLQAALGDRRLDVRRTAAGLLVRIPGSTFAQRLDAKARPLLHITGKLRPSLSVALPTMELDAELGALAGQAPRGIGDRAWVLRSVVSYVRPSRWTEWLRMNPRELIGRGVRSDDAMAVLEGWILACARFGDRDWAKAMLAAEEVRGKVTINVLAVLEGLTVPERVAVAQASARHLEPAMLARIASLCPPPWPKALIDMVISTITSAGASDYPDQSYYELVRSAALGMPPQRADDLAWLASHRGEIRPALEGAVETIRLRVRIHEAFAALPAA